MCCGYGLKAILLLNVCGARGRLGSDFHGDERGLLLLLLLLLQEMGPLHWSLGLEAPPCFWFLVEHIQRLEQELFMPFCA